LLLSRSLVCLWRLPPGSELSAKIPISTQSGGFSLIGELMSATTAWYFDGRGITLRISPSQRSASSPGNTPWTNPGFKRLPPADEMTAPRTTTSHITGPAIANIFRECCHRLIVERVSVVVGRLTTESPESGAQIDNVEFERLLPGSFLPKKNNRKTAHGKRPLNGLCFEIYHAALGVSLLCQDNEEEG
jgi:hypothetical protein